MYKLEEENKHKLLSYLLNIGIILSLLITISITMVYLYFGASTKKIILTAIFPIFMLPFSYLIYKISKKGDTDKALKIYILGTSIVIMLAVLLFRGIYSASSNLFVWIVLISGMLLKPKYSLYSSLFFTVYLLLIAALQFTGIYIPPNSNPDKITIILNIIYNIIITTLAVGYMTYINMKELNKIKDKLIHNSYHDYLTNLLNRLGFKESILISLEKVNSNKIVLIFIDIDNFKEVNDRLGHDAGDKLLVKIAKRLNNFSNNQYEISRFGGDEFVLFIEYNKSIEYLKKDIDNRLLESLTIPYRVNEHEFKITASIGVSIYPDNSSNRKELVSNADIAMYNSKKEGKNRITYYSPNLKDVITKKIDIKNKLRKAIKKNELVVHYQPQTDITTNKIIGLEALIRWKLQGKLIYPDNFIHIAEESSIILEIGDWILKEACKDLKVWHDNNKMISVSVNMSSLQFKQKDIVNKIKSIIQETQINPKYLEIEITETGLMQQDDSIIDKIAKIKKLGIKISIDDFGTGYSSLAYLKQFHVDKVKIDKSFIWKLEENQDDKPIIKAIIAISQTLNLEIIAEGVETKYQKDFLENNGCKMYQGYYYSKPVTKIKINELINKENNN